jgi:hypothetical protein
MNDHAADIVAMLHVAFVAFVLGGFVLLIAGQFLKWRWTRNRWLRGAHLAAVAYTLIRTWLGAPCPLTTWENALRHTAAAGWIAVCHRLFFRGADHQRFTLSVTVFAIIVIASFLLTARRSRCA